ncbi:hypothetical protein NUACC21_55180 [Scytonema sp. NUACC21]
MLTQERTTNKKITTRIMIILLTLLLSKNLELEIIRPDFTLKISIETVYIQSVAKLLEWL